ncbi:hypothetical protein ACHWQZ_G002561 [Mnemiopsis leidyi]
MSTAIGPPLPPYQVIKVGNKCYMEGKLIRPARSRTVNCQRPTSPCANSPRSVDDDCLCPSPEGAEKKKWGC